MTQDSSIHVRVFRTACEATEAVTDWLATKLVEAETRSIMLAGGNTPLSLYEKVAQRNLSLNHLNVFALDEYVGVPKEEPRNCANLIRSSVVQAWNIPARQYHAISSCEREAPQAIAQHEETIRSVDGLDLVVLGLGQNGHIGFNEPGSSPESTGRVVPLSDESINANRQWFKGTYAPSSGVTTGMQTILSARCLVLLAFGSLKSEAVARMIEGPPKQSCPASYLQTHPNAFVYLDEQAAKRLANKTRGAAKPRQGDA